MQQRDRDEGEQQEEPRRNVEDTTPKGRGYAGEILKKTAEGTEIQGAETWKEETEKTGEAQQEETHCTPGTTVLAPWNAVAKTIGAFEVNQAQK